MVMVSDGWLYAEVMVMVVMQNAEEAEWVRDRIVDAQKAARVRKSGET